tara:strand:+ start:2424 stop:3518 length:1095 start_codon:yes stop_codon:yes gene_type:complete
MLLRINKIFFLKKILLFILNITFFISCENNNLSNSEYIDPQIIFSSRRWWNYDIFIHDIYGGHSTQITKNKWIDFNPAISPDSKKLLFVSDRDGNREIYATDLEWLDGYTQWRGNNLRNITNSQESDWTPVYSPVEDRIAFATYFPQNDNYDIFIMNDDGSKKENLTNTSSYEKFPQFSPDGSFIIYQGWQKGKMDIFFISLLDRNNINITRNVNHNDIISHGNSFSPDGESIVFTSERDGNRNLYLMNINGDSLIRLTQNQANDYEPIFSPDGGSIVFTSERDGNKEIYLLDLESKNLKNLSNNTGDDWNPRFYPDNKKIIFQSTRDGNWEIYMMELNGKNQTNLTNNPSTDYSFIVLPLTNP